MTKFWWKGEPLIIGSFRWRIINNDLKNEISNTFKQLKSLTTINEVVKMAHDKGLRISFKLVPK